MCGIAGFCDFKSNFMQEEPKWREILVQMREAVAHRGRDQTGEYLRPHAGFAHTRLSIRDLALGAQPMVRQAGGAECAIVYNGEIYNADELRRGLEARGWRFETTCDTEAVLCAYMEYGERFAEKLNGIFALAIWDSRRRQLVLCRDRLGVKPLFYAQRGTTLVFGSEPKALFRHPLVTPEADLDSFREIFGIGPARTPGCGVFKGVKELLPGWLAVLDEDGLHKRAYWRLEARPHTDTYAETVEKVAFLLKDAVERQMVADVPVCSFLSGGVDSSVITALASNHLQKQGAQLNTFSFDFAHNDESFQANTFQPSRDRPYVDKVLALYPLRHTYLECDEAELAGLLSASLASKDLPGMADVDASLLYFCSLVKRQCKVALTGECADEIFGGYPWFYRDELFHADGFPWSADLSPRTALLTDEAKRELDLEGYVRAQYEQSLAETPLLPGESGDEKRRREVSYLNLRWFMQTLLDRMDRASMACGLEARVPFADHRIVEYVYNVPWEFKYQRGVEKALLRDASKALLPPELLWRKKSPYPKTYSPQYEAILAQRLAHVLADNRAPLHRFVDAKKSAQFLAAPKDYGRPWFGQLMAGPQMIAYLLQVNEWMVKYKIA